MQTDRHSSLRHRLFAAIAVLFAVVALSFAGAGSAAAQTDPSGPTQEFPYPHDGCTLVPEAPAGVSFTTACNHHDGCYYNHSDTRRGCDATLYRELVGACNAQPTVNYVACRTWAAIYYAGVRAFGQYFWDAGGATRTATPMQG